MDAERVQSAKLTLAPLVNLNFWESVLKRAAYSVLLLLRPHCTAQQLRGLQRVGQTLFRRFFPPLQAKANVCHFSPVDGPSPKHSRVFHFPVGVCRLVFHRLKITSLVNWNNRKSFIWKWSKFAIFADIMKLKVKIFCKKFFSTRI